MVLKGERLPSDRFVSQLADHADLSITERRYLELLVRHDRILRRGSAVPASLSRELKALSKAENQRRQLSLVFFELIGHWYFLVIKQLVTAKAFDGEIKWLQQKLGNKLSPHRLKEAVDRMTRLGILSQDPLTGKIRSNAQEGFLSPDEVPSPAIRKFHREALTQAAAALDTQGIEQREFQSLILKVRPERMGEFKKWIKEFSARSEREFQDDECEHVYQLNVQLFRQTR